MQGLFYFLLWNCAMHLFTSLLLLPHFIYLLKILLLILQLPMMRFFFFKLLFSPLVYSFVAGGLHLHSLLAISHPTFASFHLVHCPPSQGLVVKPLSRF